MVISLNSLQLYIYESARTCMMIAMSYTHIDNIQTVPACVYMGEEQFLDLRFRLMLTLKNNAACVYMGDERFRLKVQVDINSKKQCSMCVHG